MSLHIGKEIWSRLKSKQSARKSLTELERIVGRGEAVPKTRLKASGQGRGNDFEGYRDLGLWHAKLDPAGQNHGDPVLVFQQDAQGDLNSIALTDHERFASSDHKRCRKWLWEHRGSIDGQRTHAAELLLADLEQEFGDATTQRLGRRT